MSVLTVSPQETILDTLPFPPPPEAQDAPLRDPHQPPSFNPSTPEDILYLPPLLSSLPSSSTLASTATRLPSIDPASLSLHKALHSFCPVTSEYASVPYADAFNWSNLELDVELEREWYCVVFRSKRRAGSDAGPLYEADKQAHEEAVQNGGLIMYWYGTPHPITGVNLATCIWQSRKHAVAANSRPHHIRAMKLAAQSYELYDLERYRLKKIAGQKHVIVESYVYGEVGW
ncbi:hypothetical protein PUNSTDRAFT_111968 [Punctularia strigosozonata HHB-11173 SS5]|uniref:uncharacterized protein n=1 Tax=Punctularia strigosozonata (strain HHB-11173) TaxID=741275 RepID=UPI0004417D87|nr:uncharacterized protein PUNSTDRAFT_111968 [Punctularia strigosozonata HHB-11173 SS5]EIN11983.1 hypothetical protein PUNSTDRAFT_111968 [Punctularia strigosozonata HHB-11173 SS5]